MSKPIGHEDGLLTFDWPSRQRSSWLLTALIFLSLLLHLAVFFLFKVEPGKTTATPTTAPAVGLLTRYGSNGQVSRENEILLNWIAAHDPSLAARTPVVMPEGLLNIPYLPSYLTPRTAPHGVPAEPSTVQFPSPKDPLEIITNSQQKNTSPEPVRKTLKTSVKFADALASNVPAGLIPPPAPQSDTPLQATQFLIGVAQNGEVRFVFPQTSSGLNDADAAAAIFIRELKFNPYESPITWGMVDIQWGDPATTSAKTH